jgi:hypothetical protein
MHAVVFVVQYEWNKTLPLFTGQLPFALYIYPTIGSPHHSRKAEGAVDKETNEPTCQTL